MSRVLRNMKITRVAVVDKGANFDEKTKDGAHIMLWKAAPSVGAVHVDAVGDQKKKEKPVKKSVKEIIKGALGLLSEADPEKRTQGAAVLAKAAEDLPDEDDVTKAVVHKADDPMCKCADCMAKSAEGVSKIAKQVTDLEKSNTDLRKQLDVEIEKREDAEMVTILKGFKATAFDMAKDPAIFRKMRKNDPEAYERMMAFLKASDLATAQSALFAKDFGTRRGAGEGSAWAQIEAKADQMIEKNANLTREQAIEKVCLANPKLAQAYRAEQQ